MKVIYIGGYGHSGSTLLEYLMTSCPALVACGEVASYKRPPPDKKTRSGVRKRYRRACTCGAEVACCPAWGFLPPREEPPLTWSHTKLLQTLTQRLCGNYSAIIDSSKTARGYFFAPFRLRRAFKNDFTLIHLTRDPRAVVWSVTKRKNRKAERKGRAHPRFILDGVMTSLGWWFANLSCELFGLVYNKCYVRIRYEDVARSPEKTLQSVFEGVLPAGQWHLEELGAGANRHQLYGNRIRYRPLALADVVEDTKWKTEMPPDYSRIVSVMSYPLRLRYGYC